MTFRAIYQLSIFLIIGSWAFAAQTEGAAITGVWRGTLGGQQTIACFDYDSRYYNLRDLQDRYLNHQEKGVNSWAESITPSRSDSNITWKINTFTPHRLVGVRINATNKKKVAFQLSKVKVPKDAGDACPASVYYAPKVAIQAIGSSPQRQFMSKPYRLLYALNKSVSTIELLDPVSGTSPLNQFFRNSLQQDIAESFDCKFRTAPLEGGYSTQSALRYWGSQWISWSVSLEGYCGGAHPLFATSLKTHDIETGESEDLWKWFKTKLDTQADEYLVCDSSFNPRNCLSAKASKIITNSKLRYDKKDCGEFAHDYIDIHSEGYEISLDKDGFRFLPKQPEAGRSLRPCFYSHVLPFSTLRPFLSKTGRDSVNKILQSTNE